MTDGGGQTGAHSGASQLLEIVGDLLAEAHPSRRISQISIDSRLDRDLGFDSLSRVELLSRIERDFDVLLPDHVASDAETPRDLLRAISGARKRSSGTGMHGIDSLELDAAEPAPTTAQTLIEAIQWHVDSHPERPLIHFYRDDDDADVMSYGQIHAAASEVAAGLQAAGLNTGDRVSMMLPTGKDYFAAFFGVLLAGGVPVPIYPPARRTQIEDHLRRHRAILENAGVTHMITVSEAKRFGRLLKSQVSTMAGVVTVDELSGAGPFQPVIVSSEDIALLQYTSGSTGQPKGVILTHGNILANLRAIGDYLQMDDSDVVVSWLPLYHDMGLIGALLGSLYYACPLILMSPLDFVTRPQRWLWAIHRYRGTLSASPNFGYEHCLRRLSQDDAEGLDLSCWRVALNGAEPVSADTIDRFCERFGRHGFRRESLMPVYGLAENALGVTFPPLGRGPLVEAVERDDLTRRGRATPARSSGGTPFRMVSCGRPLPGNEVRIVDDDGRELPDRQVGRLQFTSPSATSGYFRNAEATQQLFDGEWRESGDLAYVSEGEVFIAGRAKDIVIRAGRNIVPSELEDAVGDIDGVRKGGVAVFGVGSESGGERLVVLAETREADNEVREALRTSIDAVAVDLAGAAPDDVRLVPPGTVLKTSSGKIRRAANRDIYERGQLRGRHRAVWLQIARAWLAGAGHRTKKARYRLASRLYAIWCWKVLILSAPFVWPAIVLAPRAQWRWACARSFARFLAKMTGNRLKIAGAENLPGDSPCIIVSNHASYLDAFALTAAMPHPVSFVAKGELRGNPFVRVLLERLCTQFVGSFAREKGIEDARRISASVRQSWPLVFFPEGSLARMPGLRSFQMGAFVAAVENGVPVVPVALHGTRSLLRPGTQHPRRSPVTVRIGRAIAATDENSATDTWAGALRLRDESREFILRHCGEPDLSDRAV